ncbi:hypothetical protein IFR05_017589, partial [Cadophora sp. M221]
GGFEYMGKFGGEGGAGIGEGVLKRPLASEILGSENGSESGSVKEEGDIKTRLADLDREMGSADMALQKVARFLAGRFAAKEATMKAHHSRRLTYHSILILKPEQEEGAGVRGSVAPVAIVLDESERRVGLRGEEEEGDG